MIPWGSDTDIDRQSYITGGAVDRLLRWRNSAPCRLIAIKTTCMTASAPGGFCKPILYKISRIFVAALECYLCHRWSVRIYKRTILNNRPTRPRNMSYHTVCICVFWLQLPIKYGIYLQSKCTFVSIHAGNINKISVFVTGHLLPFIDGLRK